MKLRLLAAVVVLAFTSIAAHAQAALYFTPIYSHIGNSKGDSSPYAFLGTNSTSQSFWGVGFGGYYEFAHSAKLNAGIDLRDTIVRGNNAALNSFQFGVRVSGKLDRHPLIKPYAQLKIGAGTSRAPSSAVKITKPVYGVLAGADYTLAKHVDWRVLEIGYGSLQTVSCETVGGTCSMPSATVISASTGLVFRF